MSTPVGAGAPNPSTPYDVKFRVLMMEHTAFLVPPEENLSADQAPDPLLWDVNLQEGARLETPNGAAMILVDLDSPDIFSRVYWVEIDSSGYGTIRWVYGQAEETNTRLQLYAGRRYAYYWVTCGESANELWEDIDYIVQEQLQLTGTETATELEEKLMEVEYLIIEQIDAMCKKFPFVRFTAKLAPSLSSMTQLTGSGWDTPFSTYDEGEHSSTIASNERFAATLLVRIMLQQAGLSSSGSKIYPTIYPGKTLLWAFKSSNASGVSSSDNIFILRRPAIASVYVAELCDRELRRRRRNASWAFTNFGLIRAAGEATAAGQPLPGIHETLVSNMRSFVVDPDAMALEMSEWVLAWAKAAHETLGANPSSSEYNSWRDPIATACDASTVASFTQEVSGRTIAASPLVQKWYSPSCDSMFKKDGSSRSAEFSAIKTTCQSYFEQYYFGLDAASFTLTDDDGAAVLNWLTVVERGEKDCQDPATKLKNWLGSWMRARAPLHEFLVQASAQMLPNYTVPSNYLEERNQQCTEEVADEVDYHFMRYLDVSANWGVNWWKTLDNSAESDQILSWDMAKKAITVANDKAGTILGYLDSYFSANAEVLVHQAMDELGAKRKPEDMFKQLTRMKSKLWVVADGLGLGGAETVSAVVKQQVEVQGELNRLKAVVENGGSSAEIKVALLKKPASAVEVVAELSEDDVAELESSIASKVGSRKLGAVPKFASAFLSLGMLAVHLSEFGKSWDEKGFIAVAELSTEIASNLSNVAACAKLIAINKTTLGLSKIATMAEKFALPVSFALSVYETADIFINPQGDLQQSYVLGDSDMLKWQLGKGALGIASVGLSGVGLAAEFGLIASCSWAGPVGWVVAGGVILVGWQISSLETEYYDKKKLLRNAFNSEFTLSGATYTSKLAQSLRRLHNGVDSLPADPLVATS